MAVKDRQLKQVVDLWYEAGFGERQWTEVLRATADLIGGGASAILNLNRSTGQVGRILVYDLDQTVNEYVTRMNGINPRVRYSLRRRGPHITTDYRVLPEAALGRNEFYDWIERHHGVRYFVGARIYDDGPCSLLASVEFSRRHGHPEDDTVSAFRHIIPHIANAWRISELVDELGSTRSIAELLVEQRRCGVFGLRRDGTILFLNAAARHVIALNDGLTIAEGRLHAAHTTTDRAIQGAMASILQSDLIELSNAGGVIAVPRRSGRMPFVLRMIACGMQGTQRGDALPAALIMLANPDQRIVPSESTLRAIGLSAAEARIAQQIVAGRTLPEAARRVGVTHNTARAHLRGIFAKTQARSQVELIRMLSEFAHIEGTEPP